MTQATKEVHLEISEYGRPIIWIAYWHYDCLPGTAVACINSSCSFSTRHEAIRWAKFMLSLQAGIDWDNWVSSDADFPYMKNCDDERFTPTFVATVEGECPRADPQHVGEIGKWKQKVWVERAEVCGEFNWFAKNWAGKSWDRGEHANAAK